MSRRARLRMGLGQTPDWLLALAAPGVAPQTIASTPATPAPGSSMTLLAPGSSLSDLLYNAATGNVSQNQKNAQIAQTTQDLIATGMDPNTAAQQANIVVTQALASAVLPGAFGITWKGANPGGPNWATAAAGDAANWLSNYWPWLVLGGIGIWWVSREL